MSMSTRFHGIAGRAEREATARFSTVGSWTSHATTSIVLQLRNVLVEVQRSGVGKGPPLRHLPAGDHLLDGHLHLLAADGVLRGGRRGTSRTRTRTLADSLTGRGLFFSYGNVSGLQHQRGDVSGGQSLTNGPFHLCYQLLREGLSRRHLQEQDHPLLPVCVVLGDTKAV